MSDLIVIAIVKLTILGIFSALCYVIKADKITWFSCGILTGSIANSDMLNSVITAFLDGFLGR